jgi:hypothetical protein
LGNARECRLDAIPINSGIPSGIFNVLAATFAAKTQTISYPTQCTHFKFPFAGLAPIDDCTIGGSADQPLIVLWGDSHAYHFERERASALKILKRIVLNIPGVSLWDPINEMCDAERCVTVHNDIVLYRDDHHLSMKASQRMSTAIGIVLDPALDERMPTATEN